ncbi:hypothetical protein [Actinomarinicola tropica]|uniref:Uncharacterized protein n=1 Tax=Actinomarinicola tropica TaxID=2789776 RepID=A0A5Q2RPA1_9ACTN|nr:hypothetical protein [Actinomarinicola tropica]QGG95035.1 hypothetical protein GH723_07900 [Actinomarinicola tropica]
MSPRRRGRKKSGRGRAGPQPLELWRAVPEPPAADPVLPTDDPGAIIRSLGTPPLTGQAHVADQYLELAARKAAATATALAQAAALLVAVDELD